MCKLRSQTEKTTGFEGVNKGYNFTTCATPAAPQGKGLSGQQCEYPGPAKSSVWVRQAHGDEEEPRTRQLRGTGTELGMGKGDTSLSHNTDPRLRSHVPALTLSSCRPADSTLTRAVDPVGCIQDIHKQHRQDNPILGGKRLWGWKLCHVTCPLGQ